MKKFRVVLILALCLMMVSLTACAAKPESLEKKYKDKGYEVELITKDDALAGDILSAMSGATAALTASKIDGDDTEFVSIMWFEDSSKAKDAYDEAKKEMDQMSDDEKDNFKVVKKGKMVAAGTKKAVGIA